MLFPGDDPWSEQSFREELRAGYHYVAARVDDDRSSATPGSAWRATEAEVHTIGVDPAHQGRGIGRALLRDLLAVADAAHAAVFLEVRTDNEPAHALYASEGFTVVGLRKRYYAAQRGRRAHHAESCHMTEDGR